MPLNYRSLTDEELLSEVERDPRRHTDPLLAELATRLTAMLDHEADRLSSAEWHSSEVPAPVPASMRR
jgi:hypothetical protein